MASEEREIVQLETVEDDDRSSSRNSNKAAAAADSKSLPDNAVVTNGMNGHGHEVNGQENGRAEEHMHELQNNGIEKDDGGDLTSGLQAEGANSNEITETMPESSPADGVHSFREASPLSDGPKADEIGSVGTVKEQKVEEKDADNKESEQELPALIGEDATARASSSGEAFIVVKSVGESDSIDGEKCPNSANDVMEDKMEEAALGSPPLGNNPVEQEVEKAQQEPPTATQVLEHVNNEIEETASLPETDGMNVVEQHIAEDQTPQKEVESILDAATTKEAPITLEIPEGTPQGAEMDAHTPEVLELANQNSDSSENAGSGVVTKPLEPLLVPIEVGKTSEATLNSNEGQEVTNSSGDGKDGNEMPPEVVTGRIEVALKEAEKVAVVDKGIEKVHSPNDLLMDVQASDLEIAGRKGTEEVIVASLTLSDNTVRENITLQQENVLEASDIKQENDGSKENPVHATATEDAKSTCGENGTSTRMTDSATLLNLDTGASSGVVIEVNEYNELKGLSGADVEESRRDKDDLQIFEAESSQAPGIMGATVLPKNEPHEFDVFQKDKVGAVAEENTAVEDRNLTKQHIQVPEIVSNVLSEVQQEVDLVSSTFPNADAGNLTKEPTVISKTEVELVPGATNEAKDILSVEKQINDTEIVASIIDTATSKNMDQVDNNHQAAMIGQDVLSQGIDESGTEVNAVGEALNFDVDLHKNASVIPTEILSDREVKSTDLITPVLQSLDTSDQFMPEASDVKVHDEEQVEAAQKSTAQDLIHVLPSEGSQQGKSDELEKEEVKLDLAFRSPEMHNQDDTTVNQVVPEVGPQPNNSSAPGISATLGKDLLPDVSPGNPTEPHLLIASRHAPIQPAPPLDVDKVHQPLDTKEPDLKGLDQLVQEAQKLAIDDSGSVALNEQGSEDRELTNPEKYDDNEATVAESEPKVPIRKAPPIPPQMAPSVSENDTKTPDASAMKKDDDIKLLEEVQQDIKIFEPDKSQVDLAKEVEGASENAPFVEGFCATDDTTRNDVSISECPASAPEYDLQEPNIQPGPPRESEPDTPIGDSQVADMPYKNEMSSEQSLNNLDNSLSRASHAKDTWIVPEPLPQMTESEKEVSVMILGEPLPEIVSTNEHVSLFYSSISNDNVASEKMPLASQNLPTQSSHVQMAEPMKSGVGNESKQVKDNNNPEQGSLLHESEPDIPTGGNNITANQTNIDIISEQNSSNNWAKFNDSPSGGSNTNDPWLTSEPLPQKTEVEKEVSFIPMGEPSPAIVSNIEETSSIDIKENVPSEEIPSLRETSPLHSSRVQSEEPMKSGDGIESRQVEEINIPANGSPAHESKPDISKDGSDVPDIQAIHDLTPQETSAVENWAKFDDSFSGASNLNDPWAAPEPLPQTSEVEKEVLVISLGEPLAEDVSNIEHPSIAVSSTTNGSATITISTATNLGDAIPDLSSKSEPEVVLTTATEATFTSKVTISEEHAPSSEPKVPVRKASRVAPPPPPKAQSKPEPEVVLSATEARFTSKVAIAEEAEIDSASSTEPKVPVRKASRAAPILPPEALPTSGSGAVTAPPRTTTMASKAAETTGAELATETPVAKPRRTTLERKKTKDGDGQSVIAYLFGPCFSCLSKK